LKILILGGDGYLGWPTALHLSDGGHDVAVLDNFARRGYDFEMGVDSLVPIDTLQARIRAWRDLTGRERSLEVDPPVGLHSEPPKAGPVGVALCSLLPYGLFLGCRGRLDSEREREGADTRVAASRVEDDLIRRSAKTERLVGFIHTRTEGDSDERSVIRANGVVGIPLGLPPISRRRWHGSG